MASVAGKISAAPMPIAARAARSAARATCASAASTEKTPNTSQADLQGALAAEAIAEAAGGQQQAGEHQRVGVDDPLQLAGGGAELADQRRQGDVHDRAVDDDDEHRQAQHREDRASGERRIGSADEWAGVAGSWVLGRFSWDGPRGALSDGYNVVITVLWSAYQVSSGTPSGSVRERPCRHRTHRSDATALLVAAARPSVGGGYPTPLTVRHRGAAAGCSTMGVYTHFGGKEGVVEALFVEGFNAYRRRRRPGRHLTDDPRATSPAGCASYRRFGAENPTHYSVMFERHVPGFEPSAESMVHAHATLVLLEARVQRCLDAGVIDAGHGDAQQIAYSVWATGHGLMSLELHHIGKRDDYDARHRTTTALLFAGLTHPPLAERDQARTRTAR